MLEKFFSYFRKPPELEWYYTPETRWVKTGQEAGNYVMIKRQYKIVCFETGEAEWCDGESMHYKNCITNRVVPVDELSEYGLDK